MNGLGSFHRIGTVAVPQGSRPEWGQTGDAATAKTKKPHVLGNGKRAPGHLPHSSEANMHVPAYRTRVLLRGYQDATVHISTCTNLTVPKQRDQHTSNTYRYPASCLRPADNVHFVRSIQVH